MATQFDFQEFLTTSENDILYGILEACGGDMSDVKQYFSKGTNDLLYAILLKIKANGGIGGGGGTGANFANTDLTFTGDRVHNLGHNSLSLEGDHSDSPYGGGILNMEHFFAILLNALRIDLDAVTIGIKGKEGVTVTAPSVEFTRFIDNVNEIKFGEIGVGRYGETNWDYYEPYLLLSQLWPDFTNRINTRFLTEEIEIDDTEFEHQSRLIFPRVGETGNDQNDFTEGAGYFYGTLATKEWVTNHKTSFDASINRTITAEVWDFKNYIHVGENHRSGLWTNDLITVLGDWSNDGANLTVDADNGLVQSWGNFQVWGVVGANDYATSNAQISSDGTISLPYISLNANGSGTFAAGNIQWDDACTMYFGGSEGFSQLIQVSPSSITGWTNLFAEQNSFQINANDGSVSFDYGLITSNGSGVLNVFDGATGGTVNADIIRTLYSAFENDGSFWADNHAISSDGSGNLDVKSISQNGVAIQPYKKYVALLNWGLSGISDATVLEDNIGITATRDGYYFFFTKSGGLDPAKTFIIGPQKQSDDDPEFYTTNSDGTGNALVWTLSNPVNEYYPVEIRVYP